MTEGAAYLYPGAPLLRGTDHIRTFLETADSIVKQTWTPIFADVSPTAGSGTRTVGRTRVDRGASTSRAGGKQERVATRGVCQHQACARRGLGDDTRSQR